uniref:AAA family ATPase n=1 Tax=Prevotella sp. TaxID=59823 RepID=UPI003FF10679
MLKQLYIKDFTLIDELNIQFFPGFSVITGETGAGKSIVIGALHLLLGQRADSKQVKLGRKKCIIEAHFDLSRYDMESFFDDNEIDYDATDCILRREVSEKGKSRAFINDTPVSLTTLRDLGDQLIDIHSQHQNLLLQKEDFQLNVVDIIAGDAALLADYKGKYSAWLQAKKAYVDYEEACCRNKENEEFLRVQFSELDRAKLVKGEEQDLEQRSQTMSHTEDIKNALFTASEALSKEDAGGMAMTRAAADSMGDIAEVYPEAKAIADRLDSAYIYLK